MYENDRALGLKCASVWRTMWLEDFALLLYTYNNWDTLPQGVNVLKGG